MSDHWPARQQTYNDSNFASQSFDATMFEAHLYLNPVGAIL